MDSENSKSIRKISQVESMVNLIENKLDGLDEVLKSTIGRREDLAAKLSPYLRGEGGLLDNQNDMIKEADEKQPQVVAVAMKLRSLAERIDEIREGVVQYNDSIISLTERFEG